MIDSQLKDKTALVTGANTGIGRATALAFAEQGTNVVVHYLGRKGEVEEPFQAEYAFGGKERAGELADQIKGLGVKAVIAEANLMLPESIPGLFAEAERAFGQVDILVNNAAHCEMPDNIFSATAPNIERHFAVNTRAGVLLISEFVKRHKRRGGTWGRIINLSTDAAQAFATQISYGASKAAIEAYTRSIAWEVGPLGVTVNTVAPGPVQTGWMSAELVEKVLPEIPLGRVGTPEDIADVIVFLASDQARWLTGQVIKVSGGHNL
ncbi:MAG: SDR family oxidoreductase [Candidatus Aminicenantales bacterium]